MVENYRIMWCSFLDIPQKRCPPNHVTIKQNTHRESHFNSNWIFLCKGPLLDLLYDLKTSFIEGNSYTGKHPWGGFIFEISQVVTSPCCECSPEELMYDLKNTLFKYHLKERAM